MFEIKPKTRKEIYMAYLAGDLSLELPEPLTRDEVTLYKLCQSHAYGTAEAYLLPETELTFEMNEDLGVPMAMISLAYEMEIGNTYTVSFDGVEYTCQAIESGASGSALGNFGAFGGDDTGEPFVIVEEGRMFVIPLNGASSAVMSIKGETVVPISTRYAPKPPLVDLVAAGFPAVGVQKQIYLEPGWLDDATGEAFSKALEEAYTGNGVVKIKVLLDSYTNMNFSYPSADGGSYHGTGESSKHIINAFVQKFGQTYAVSAIYHQNFYFYMEFGEDDHGMGAIVRRLALEKVTG